MAEIIGRDNMKKNIRNLLLIIKKLNYILDRKQKVKSVKVGIIIVMSSMLDLLGVTSILPFVQAVTAPQELMKKEYILFFLNLFGFTTATQMLVMIGCGIIVVYIIKNIFMIYSYYVTQDYSSGISMQLSIKMLSSYMLRPYTFFLDVNSAQIIRGCTSDVNGIYIIMYQFILLVNECLSAIIIGIYLLYTDVFIAGLVSILMIVVMLGMILIFKPIFKKVGKKYIVVATAKWKAINQNIMGAKEILVNHRQKAFEMEYIKAADEERRINRVKDTLAQSPDRIVEGICVSGIIGIVCIRLLMQDDNMVAFIPKLAAFAMAAFKIFPSIGKITSRLNTIVYQIPALDSVYNNLKTADEYLCRIEKTQQIECKENGRYLKNEIVLSNVLWKYDNQKKFVLRDVNIQIKRGQSVGLIGASGAGKTTVSDIILGLLKPQSGSVTVDGVDIYSIKRQWAEVIGYVPQSVFLLDDTVRNNILFGLPLEDDDEKIWEALQQAQLKDFILSLPDGLDTVVGERGVKFSGGQRQRIAIARALYNNPEILVLDEATASLDNETESALMESIDELQGKITMIIVAHRLSTISKCDIVYEIKDGVAIKRNKEEIIKC